MSLFRQIQTLITVVLIVMLAIVMKVNFDRARDYSGVQLYNNAKNSANVLALSLSSAPSDAAFMESAISAMFDGGYYEKIELVDADGVSLYKRSEAVRVEGVPQFFIGMVALDPPVAESRVMNGWTVFGTLKVAGHPGHAYLRLWETFKQLALTFVFIGVSAISVCWVLLRFLLRSLVEIRSQAEAVSRHEFIINTKVPNTPELKEVTLAMNTMVGKVKTIFDRQLQYIRDFQELNFKDADTGIYNRAYFVKQLGHFLDSESGTSSGTTLILSIKGLEGVGLPDGHPVLHGFFEQLVALMSHGSAHVPERVIARLSQHEFGLLLPGCLNDEAHDLAKGLMEDAQAMTLGSSEFTGRVTFSGGMAPYACEDETGGVLSRADYALSAAKAGAPWKVIAFRGGEEPRVSGKYEWKRMLDDAFANGRFQLASQPVISDAGELHRELYAILTDKNGKEYRAGHFMPMVITLGYAAQLDRYVLEAAAAELVKTRDGVFAVNLTREFCRDRESLLWLRTFLNAHRDSRHRLVFEFQEAMLLQFPDISMDLAGLFRGMGYGFGLDQCSAQEASLHLVKDLKPDYLKVDVDTLMESGQNGSAGVALNALATITDSLGIRLVASKVETEVQKSMLARRKISCLQGRAIAGVTPFG